MSTITFPTVGLPATVEIGPFTYDVTTDPAEIDTITTDAVLAAIDPASLLIGIEPTQDLGQMRDSLLHEVLHGITFVNGLDMEIDAAQLEEIVNRVSPLLLDTIRRNTALVAFLLAEP
jgi:hypothetical protein